MAEREKFFSFLKKFFPCLGNPAHPRAAVPPLMKKKSRQIRAAGIQPVTGEEGPESDRSGGQYAPAWRSPFPRQENTQTGANGVFLKPRQHATAAPGHQRPAFARIKKTGISHKQFFSERQQDRCTAKSAIRLTPFQIPEAGGGAGPPHPGQRLYHARPMSAACPHAAREQRSKNKNVRILIYNLHFLS